MLEKNEVKSGEYQFAYREEGLADKILYTQKIGTDIVLLIHAPQRKLMVMARQLEAKALEQMYAELCCLAEKEPVFEVHFIGGEDFSEATEHVYQQETNDKKYEAIGKKLDEIIDKAAHIDLEKKTLTTQSSNKQWKIKQLPKKETLLSPYPQPDKKNGKH